LRRVGGEEFALLLRAHEAEAALGHVDAMQQAIVDLGLPHSGTAMQVVSASFGLVLWPAGRRHLRSTDIYKSADDLLYDAKATGRNRVLMKMMPAPAPALHEPLRIGT
jgi:diguanylate cyclase (GGDEF)-like protein